MLASAVDAQGRECPMLNHSGLVEILRARGPATTKIEFFATWCSSCKEHLLEADKSALVIALFDEKAKVEKTVTALGGNFFCFVDDDRSISSRLNIKSVPASFVYKNGSFTRTK